MTQDLKVFEKLEEQVKKLVDLIDDLKEENKKLKSDNDSLKNFNNVIQQDKSDNSNKALTGVNKDQTDTIKEKVKNAMEELNQLRLMVVNDS